MFVTELAKLSNDFFSRELVIRMDVLVLASVNSHPPKLARIFSALIAAENCPSASALCDRSDSRLSCPINVTPYLRSRS